MTSRDALRRSLFNPETNCWRVEQADKLTFIIDGADYFLNLRKIIAQSKQQLLLIGWDFDLEIEMMPGESDDDGNAADGLPNRLDSFLEAVVKRTPDLQIYMLKWNGAVVAAPGRLVPSLALSMFGNDQIRFALDGHHPFGACHHQKIVIADDTFAFCGGIDATENRWDTTEHLPDDPRRVLKDGTLAQPWHDATSAMTGPAASALAELARKRWERATGETLDRPSEPHPPLWPDALEVEATGVDVCLARTEPPYDGAPLINEVEHLFLDSIKAARDTIYIESQYFAAETISDALQARLQEPDGPEVVVINPETAQSEFEDDAMHVLRNRVMDELAAADRYDRFRIYYPVNAAEQPIYVHAKIMIVDTALLHLGSSNINNRSLGFDTECDIAIADEKALIAHTRARLVAEHLGVDPDTFNKVHADTPSLIATIETLNKPDGRGLRRLYKRDETLRSLALANTRLMDPRYTPEDRTTAGEGVRPRHLALVGGLAALGFVGWKAIQRWTRQSR